MGTRISTAIAVALLLGAARHASAYTNGDMPASALSPIYQPSARNYLRTDAARAWNAMRDYIRRNHGIDIYSGGSLSAYRTYSQPAYCRQHFGSNPAVPGTSN